MKNNTSLDVRERQALIDAVNAIGSIVTKEYLHKLDEYHVFPIPEDWESASVFDKTRLFHLKKIVSDPDESMIDKLVTVLGAAYSCGATVISIIMSDGKSVQYYLGTVDKENKNRVGSSGIGTVLSDTLKGNFPGVVVEGDNPIDEDSLKKLLEKVCSNDNNFVSAISGVASLRKDNNTEIKKYVQGIEHLVDSLQGKSYSIVLIADPVSAENLTVTKKAYEELSTRLSPYLNSSISFNDAETLTHTLTEGRSATETITDSEGKTKNTTITNGKSSGHTTSKGVTKDKRDKGRLIGGAAGGIFGGALAGVAAAGAVAAIPVVGQAAAPIIAAVAIAGGMSKGKQLGSNLGATIGGMQGSTTNTISDTESITSSVAQSTGENTQHSVAKSNGTSSTKSDAQGSTHGRTLQYTVENKTVKNLIQRIDKNIERIQKCESYGVFECATYVITTDDETLATVSNGYNALMRGEKSYLQASQINTWGGTDSSGEIKKYLERFRHPLFVTSDSGILVTPASMISSDELSIAIGLPKRSIPGLPVVETASFGRNVIGVDGETRGNIKIGKIYHMNRAESGDVLLDENALCSHVFITGSTGSGKSNAVYQLLGQLEKKGKSGFMIVEPAKGEYKDVFGNNPDVHVYGTNPNLTRLLRINPFRFPSNVHVYEHMERIIDVFNVCWPLYAAMPAILKASIEKAYVAAGWDLKRSINTTGYDIYPSFDTVADEVRKYLDKSDYDELNKGSYKGALLTRLESLTNGVNGMIFTANDISDEELFDKKVIVDLSRLGSSETKALIMGVLIIRMQEYRSSTSVKNSSFKHLTVLEEAHNILRRTSFEQNDEGSNIAGKSVEMLSNSIAEMRTYGEAFAIVDQSPGLLDMSAIRNTNTKIILRLPDYSDRELVGKSANLNDEQIKELAKLRTGVAAVYQNDWISPVLCKFDKFQADGKVTCNLDNENMEEIYTNQEIAGILTNAYRKTYCEGEMGDQEKRDMAELVIKSTIPVRAKSDAIRFIESTSADSAEKEVFLRRALYSLLDAERLLSNSIDAEGIDVWTNRIFEEMGQSENPFSREQREFFITMVMKEHTYRHPEYETFYESYKESHLRSRV